MSDYRTFVVPYDFSPHAHAALQTALEIGRRLQADLHLVHVVIPPAYVGGCGYGPAAVPPTLEVLEIRESALRPLRQVASEIADAPGKVEVHVAEGVHIVDTLHDTAQRLGADLIVMATHGRTGLSRVFLGSVAERTLRGAPCPVLAVPADEAAEDEAGRAAPHGVRTPR